MTANLGRIVDASALKGLAHPLRMAILESLETRGRATASMLAADLGESSGATSYHLRQLFRHGFVEEVPDHGNARERWWRPVTGGWSLPPEARDIGMVFQDYALWPHMTVAQNVAFPLRMRNIPRQERDARVAQALSRVGLSAFADRKPAGLSGGQQQRVALARAIVAEPRVLLFDEPLSNLDSELRESLCLEMATLLRQLGTTAVYVTHDRREAEILADRIVHLSAGSVAADRLISSSGEFA